MKGQQVITISLCMIVKNEEMVIERCLKTVADIVDEIIIIDTGSTDNTKEIASKFTTKIYDFVWIDDFSVARNYSFSKATMDYQFWLDADDVILEEDRTKLKQLKHVLSLNTDVVMMKYNVGFDEEDHVTLSYYRERLLKKERNFIWEDPIHEYIEVSGHVINENICITHKKMHGESDRNLKIFNKMVLERKDLSPRNLFYYARELYHHENYDDAILYFNKFLDSGEGWVEDNICACYDLSKCYTAIKDYNKAFHSLNRSFLYDTPRAEIVCEIGYYHKELKNYERAIFWFDLALKLKKPEKSWGFILNDYWGYIPAIELCVCYDRLGMVKEAEEFNKVAEQYKPNAAGVIFNKKYFLELKQDRL